MLTTNLGWTLGILLGMRHALEPDHLAAISTLVAERRSSKDGFVLGTAWGIGHTLTLTIVGGALFLLREQFPSWAENLLECFVALMLLFLGFRALLRGIGEFHKGEEGVHSHSTLYPPYQMTHTHAGADHPHFHLGPWSFAWKPLLVGLVHGLAGTGALTAAVLAQFTSPLEGLVYILLFGIGSTFGMALLAGALGAPLARMIRNSRASGLLLGTTGAISVVVAIEWGWTSIRPLIQS